jgi:hypothetical protein
LPDLAYSVTHLIKHHVEFKFFAKSKIIQIFSGCQQCGLFKNGWIFWDNPCPNNHYLMIWWSDPGNGDRNVL